MMLAARPAAVDGASSGLGARSEGLAWEQSEVASAANLQGPGVTKLALKLASPASQGAQSQRPAAAPGPRPQVMKYTNGGLPEWKGRPGCCPSRC